MSVFFSRKKFMCQKDLKSHKTQAATLTNPSWGRALFWCCTAVDSSRAASSTESRCPRLHPFIKSPAA